jgi:hypothetical protein
MEKKFTTAQDGIEPKQGVSMTCTEKILMVPENLMIFFFPCY